MVEPDDLACNDDESPYDCPLGFDATSLHCQLTKKKGWWTPTTTWCCPR
jgi:hypothetical protein